jgi:CPA1 family monovalent cation:H+ antiporter
MTIESSFIILFCVATAVAIAVRRLRIPYTVALVIAGLALGTVRPVALPHLTKELLFSVFLPGLLFEAAFHLEYADFRRHWAAISALAIPGVIAAVGLTALIVTPVITGLALDIGFTWTYGLVFGALIAATDPVAVTALFRQLHAPKDLSVLIEGESLLNDGTSIIFLTLILAYVTGAAPSAGSLLVEFVKVTGGGALVGIAVGVAVSLVIRRIDEPMIEITLTTIAAYGSFVLGEQLRVSGVIATVTAGMLCGSYGRPTGMSPMTKVAVETFWEYVAFALNSAVFLLIGFEVSLGSLIQQWREIAVAYLAVVIARAGVVFVVGLFLRGTRRRIPPSWMVVLTWGGLRGALSMVLALSLAADFPHRSLIVTMTVGVVLLSLLVQGITMAPLLRRTGMIAAVAPGHDYHVARAHLQTAAAGIAAIDHLTRSLAAPAEVLQRFRERYEERRRSAEADLRALHDAHDEVRRDASDRTVRQLLAVEQDQALEAFRSSAIDREAYHTMANDIAARIVRLERGDYDDPADLLVSPAPKSDSLVASPTDRR